jgi:hypothetical protein
MGTTLKKLRDQVARKAGIVGNAQFPETRVNQIVNLAQRYVQIALCGLGMKKWETYQVITAGLTAEAFKSGTSNVKTVEIDSTYFPRLLESPKSIKLIEVDDTTNYGIAKEVDEHIFADLLGDSYSTPTVNNPIFMRLSNKIYLAPLAITTAKAHFFQSVGDLSSDSSETIIPFEFEEFIIRKAVMEIDEVLGKISNKQLASSQLDNELKTVYSQFTLRDMEDTTRIKQSDNAQLQ